jgi:hypothetical protein
MVPFLGQVVLRRTSSDAYSSREIEVILAKMTGKDAQTTTEPPQPGEIAFFHRRTMVLSVDCQEKSRRLGRSSLLLDDSELATPRFHYMHQTHTFFPMYESLCRRRYILIRLNTS